MTWDDAIRLIRDGEDVEHVLDMKSETDKQAFRAFLLAEAGADALAAHDARMKDVESGVHQARMLWHSISEAQRRALEFAGQCGRLTQMYKQFLDYDNLSHRPTAPIRLPTIRHLCDRDLMAWDGGTFNPEHAAVITERGRFVVKHGPSGPKP